MSRRRNSRTNLKTLNQPRAFLESGLSNTRRAPRLSFTPSWIAPFARVRRYVEEGEGERVGKVQARSHTLSGDHRNWTMKFYGFGFLPSPGALAEGATGLGFQKFGSALIHSSCT
jgi:hypothetical protein